jgi:hypothetical protein
MLKIALLVWIMLGTTLAGVAMTVIVATPSLADQAMKLIPIACGAAIVIAIPLSYWVAGRITAATRDSLQR